MWSKKIFRLLPLLLKYRTLMVERYSLGLEAVMVRSVSRVFVRSDALRFRASGCIV